MMLSVLIIGDDRTLERAKKMFPRSAGEVDFLLLPTLPDAVTEIKKGPFDLLVTDYSNDQHTMDQFSRFFSSTSTELPLLVLTGNGNNRDKSVIQPEDHGDKKSSSVHQTRELFAKLGSRISQRLEKNSILERQKESQARICSILASINTGVLIVDRKNRTILHANEYALRIMEKSPGEVTGLDYRNFIAISDSSFTFASLAGEEVIRTEGDLLGNNGIVIPIILNITPVRLFSGINILITFLDNRSQKKTEKALADSEEMYRKLVETSPDAILLTGIAGDILKANNNALQIFGFTSEEDITGCAIGDLVSRDDQGTAADYLAHLMNKGWSRKELVAHSHGGHSYPIEISSSIIKDNDGNPVSIIHVIRDLTSQKQAAEALRASEERYRNIVEDQNEFICRFLPDGTHVFVNGAYCRYFGMTREEVRGSRFIPTIHPDDRDALKQHFRSLSRDNPVAMIDHRIIMPDGKIRWQRWSDRAIFDGNGNLLEYQSVGRDITERKEAEIALLASEERYRHVVEDQEEFICRFLPDGTHVFVNGAYCRYFGMTKEEVRGSRFMPTIHPDDRDALKQHFRSLSRDNPVAMIEHRIIMPDGKIRWQRWSDRAIFDGKGNLVEYQSVGRDITYRKNETSKA